MKNVRHGKRREKPPKKPHVPKPSRNCHTNTARRFLAECHPLRPSRTRSPPCPAHLPLNPPRPRDAAFSNCPPALLGSALAAGLPIARSVHAAGSDILQVGLIGCGGRGAGAAVNALNADPHARLVALGDVFPDMLNSTRATSSAAKPEQTAVDDDHCFVGLRRLSKGDRLFGRGAVGPADLFPSDLSQSLRRRGQARVLREDPRAGCPRRQAGLGGRRSRQAERTEHRLRLGLAIPHGRPGDHEARATTGPSAG